MLDVLYHFAAHLYLDLKSSGTNMKDCHVPIFKSCLPLSFPYGGANRVGRPWASGEDAGRVS